VTEFPGQIPFYVPFPDIRPFIKGFFALAQSQFHLHPAFFKIKGKGDKGIPLFIHLPGQALDLLPVEEEFFLPARVMVEY
jgi:hypothetical protein